MKIWIENDYWESTVADTHLFVIIFIGIKYTSPDNIFSSVPAQGAENNTNSIIIINRLIASQY